MAMRVGGGGEGLEAAGAGPIFRRCLWDDERERWVIFPQASGCAFLVGAPCTAAEVWLELGRMVFVPRRVDFRSRMAGHETKLMIPCPAIGLFVGAAPVLCALLMDMSLGFAPDMCGGDDPANITEDILQNRPFVFDNSVIVRSSDSKSFLTLDKQGGFKNL
ncbi:uncharacterized protein [Physcomitrium patens]|uniref:uncharacterized protein n=1 Tax=Physcomitrium patens TaxID=3218 RepID=UPI003CCD0683